MTDAPNYRILALVAENFKKLKAVSIRPDGALVQVSGKNRRGKPPPTRWPTARRRSGA